MRSLQLPCEVNSVSKFFLLDINAALLRLGFREAHKKLPFATYLAAIGLAYFLIMLSLVALWLYAGAVAAGDQAVTGNSGDPASGSAASEGSVPGSFVPGSIVPGPANSRWIPEFTNLVSFGDRYFLCGPSRNPS